MNSIIYFFAVYTIYIIPIVLVVYIINHDNRKLAYREMLVILLSGVTSYIISFFLKVYINIPRPDLTLALFVPTDNYSFPSGHTAFIIGIATAMYMYHPKLSTITFLLGLLVGFARVLAGVHTYIDIAGGIFVGMLVGHIIRVIIEECFRGKHKKA